MQNIAIIFGGTAPESEVSVITGVLTTNSIDKEKFNAVPIFISKCGIWFTGEALKNPDNYKNLDIKKLQKVSFSLNDNYLYVIKNKKLKRLMPIYAVINCLHGERGEDGTIAGLFKCVNIPYASPDILASSVTMDKDITKYILGGLNISSLPHKTVFIDEKDEDIVLPFNFPVIVKPCLGGSSIGIGKASSVSELKEKLEYAFSFGKKVIIEPFIENFTEINCAVYKDDNGKIVVSECEQPVSKNEILSFNDKYVSGGRIFPARIEKSLSDKIKETAKRVYYSLDFKGVIRIDFMIIENKPVINEINSIPGSLAYYLFSESLDEFKKMLTKLVEYSVKEFKENKKYKREYESKILYGFQGKGAKHLIN